MATVIPLPPGWMRDYQLAEDKTAFLRDWADQLFMRCRHCQDADELRMLLDNIRATLTHANELQRDRHRHRKTQAMASATLVVRYPDGTFRYGIYHAASNVASDYLYRDPGTAWDKRGTPQPKAPTWYQEGDGQPVEVYTDHGGGFWWTATATQEYLTSNRDIMLDEVEVTHGAPEWVEEAFR